MSLTVEQIPGQLKRIEEIQREIRRVLLDESLDGLDDLLAEKRSRLSTLLPAVRTGIELYEEYTGCMRSVLEADRELERLMRQKLKVLGNRLKKTHQSRHAATQYTISPARKNAELMRSTDVTG